MTPPPQRFVVPFTLVLTMTVSSFQIFAIAVLASKIIADLEVSRTVLGGLGSINTVVGALSAPWSGRLTDRIGPVHSIRIVLAVSGLGLTVMALSTTWWLLGVSAVISGLPQGWGNPATNALIVGRVEEARRGVLTGVKQSGVQVGVFLSGITLPTLSVWLGWRGAMWVFAAACFLLAIAIPMILASDDASARTPARSHGESAASKTPLDPLIVRVALYALLMGSAGGAVSRFFPLWAEEVVGFSNRTAGVIVALTGLFGIATRIAVGRVADKSFHPARLLGLLALVGAVYCLVLALTTTVGPWVLWLSPVLAAVGIAAWNAVAMLTVIVTVPRAEAGRASGVVMFGFLGGLSIGSPLAGLVIDVFDSYQPMFVGALVLALAAAAITLPGTGRKRSPVSDPAGAQ